MDKRTLPKQKHLAKTRKGSWKALSDSDLEDLSASIQRTFKWEHEPRQFQLDAIKAQLQRKDVIVHAGTGFGKTAIAAGPHALEEMKGKVTFLISPLIALQEEQAATFESEFHLSAVAINSTHGGLNKKLLSDIREGRWQIVVISPEMMLSKAFLSQVIRHRDMLQRTLAVVVDEAHVVSHWGSGFRKQYGTLGILKALLPRETPFVALSATLPPRVRNDVEKKLQLNQKTLVSIDMGNDRTTVSLIVRGMQHSMNTYNDLALAVPDGIETPDEIPKAFIYADTLAVATQIETYLYEERCPKDLWYKGFIRPYSAAFSSAYRHAVMVLFRMGIVRILICTDAAGMGCNIPDIDLVIQWKLPASVSSFVQRAGRAARGHGRTGLAVLLVEKSVYEGDVVTYVTQRQSEQVQEKGKSKPKKSSVREAASYPKGEKGYAVARGSLRGGYDKANDTTNDPIDVPLDESAIDEGLYTLVQTGKCRRGVLTKVFGNKPAEPTVPCCDTCDPSLLDRARPGPPKIAKRAVAVKRGIPNLLVMEQIRAWRVRIHDKAFTRSFFSPAGFMSNDLVELLASVGPINTKAKLLAVLGGQWARSFATYGDALLTELKRINIPPMKPKPKKKKDNAKRPQAASDTGEGNDDGRGRKRARVASSTIATPTAPAIEAVTPAVNPSPAPVPVTNSPLPQTPARSSSASSNPYSALRSVGATAAASSSPALYPYPGYPQAYPSTPIQIRYGSFTHPWPLEPRNPPQPGLVVASVWCGEAYGYALRWVPPPQAPGASQVPAPGPART
ncbi:hypothetical protein D9611_014814 [Ephemerocybe angulata]|uniref:DNA 3'-5' helicase n=1 Tax=Ephemerocybe angulata TaxID=980116 RepID=A0A8H5FED9_9AGAR|nr:hypothetical protein D9611_014875 [Tulosesus angulatus]KAF5334045.1 hypothetical protein D9611_014814 [Tulosesus angulatus]